MSESRSAFDLAWLELFTGLSLLKCFSEGIELTPTSQIGVYDESGLVPNGCNPASGFTYSLHSQEINLREGRKFWGASRQTFTGSSVQEVVCFMMLS